MPYIPTEPVKSSNIERIGYERKQQILRIIFQGNRAYDYPMVTEREFEAFMAAESKGRFFNSRIKPMYAHRTPREVELVEPCCEHDGPDPTCTEECYPCHDTCCPGGSTGSSPKDIAAAISGGREFGSSFRTETENEATSRIKKEKVVEFGMAYGASPALLEELSSEESEEGVDHNYPDCGCTEESRCPSLVDADSDTVIPIISTDEDEKACLHPNTESMSDGSNPVCAACGVDLSQSGDCTHGADGRTCEEGCGCIPCHAPQDEEETNGNSD